MEAVVHSDLQKFEFSESDFLHLPVLRFAIDIIEFGNETNIYIQFLH